MPTFTSWGEAILTSLANTVNLFLAAVPKIIGFLVILLIGWFIAGLIARAVAAGLRAVKFNALADRSGISGFVSNMGVQTDASGVLADVVKWFFRLIVLIVAFDELNMPAVSLVLQQLLLWIPNLVVAMVVLVVAGLVANALGDLVRGATAEAGFGNSNLLATITRVAIWAFGALIALNQIGVASSLVNILFMGLVGGTALALGLSFGLGGRDTAGEIIHNWYQRGQESAPKLQQAAAAAQRKAQEQTQREMQSQQETERQRETRVEWQSGGGNQTPEP